MWLNFVLVLLGAAAFLVYKLSKVYTRTDFDKAIFLKRNIPVLILNLLVGIGAILSNFIHSFEINGNDLQEMWWFFVGAGGQFLFRKGYKQFEDKNNTKP